MSKYTSQIRMICEGLLNHKKQEGYLSIDNIIKNVRPLIFSFDYPIFDQEYRPVLETKILKHYYTREIGMETYGLWKLRLETKLNEIMPYYNKLYLSGLADFNPLWDTDITTEVKGKKTGDRGREETVKETASKDSTNDTEARTEQDASTIQDQTDEGTTFETGTSTRSDTPQGGLDGLITDDYLTEASRETKEGRDSRSMHAEGGTNMVTNLTQGVTGQENETRDISRNEGENTTSTEDYVTRTFGRQGSTVAEILETLKSELLNIDMMIIKDLECLFMNVW